MNERGGGNPQVIRANQVTCAREFSIELTVLP